MRIVIFLSLLISLCSLSCKETVVQNPVQNGSLFIDSKPAGAKIFIQGTFDNQYTPATLNNLEPDTYDIMVEVDSEVDSAFSLDVKANLTTSKTIDFYDKMSKCYFQSNPSRAEIFLDDLNTGLLTPSIVGYLNSRMHSYKLKLNDRVIEDSFFVYSGQTKNIYEEFNMVEPTGSIYISSSPEGAAVNLDGTNTVKVTPDSVTGIVPGQHTITLSLSGYRDTSFTVNVQANLLTNKMISLVSTVSLTFYGPIRIYETSGSASNQPSGLDLSASTAYGLSGTDKDNVDIYYSTDGTGGNPLLVQSADLYPDLMRHTAFNVGSGTELNDGQDSPSYPLSGWTEYMSDRESDYVFLYDEDGHYSKIIITDFHSSSGMGDPSWVEVKWIYNNTGADRRF